MSNVDDVADAILSRVGEVTTWKLQKLVYYAQAWSLVRYDRPLFNDVIEAWREGPVVRSLYNQHRRKSRVRHWPGGDKTHLDAPEHDLIAWVVEKYGKLSAETLSEMTHAEAPWFIARGLLPASASSDEPIDLKITKSFYARQEASADTAVRQAVANSTLEGMDVDEDWRQQLYKVADGSTSADDLIQAEIDRLHGG